MKKLLLILTISTSILSFGEGAYPSQSDKDRAMSLFNAKKTAITLEDIHLNVRGKLWSNEADSKKILDTLVSEGKLKKVKWYYVKK